MWSEVFWMSRHRKDDGQESDQTHDNDVPLPSPHIQVGGDGEVDPPSRTFNTFSFFHDSVWICSTHTYNDCEIKSTRSVLGVRYQSAGRAQTLALWTPLLTANNSLWAQTY